MTSGDSIDDIVDQVQRAATPEKLNHLDAVAARLVGVQEEVRGFLRTIRSRPVVMFYISASLVKEAKPDLTLSVRIHGVECGQVKLTGSPDRQFTPKNLSHFSDCWGDAAVTSLQWRDPRVRRYLAAVAETTISGALRSREAGLEAATLRSIQGDGAAWRNQAVVKYPVRGSSGIPYQFPLPIRARGGVKPVGGTGAGHADILIRRGRGRSSRLRVLELKRPGADDAAASLDQAVAYAAALDLLMERGTAYRALLGYEMFTPPLEATAFVEDSSEARAVLSTAISRLGRESKRLPRLQLSALMYRWDPVSGGKVEITHALP